MRAAVDRELVVSAHDGTDARFHGRLKRRVVHLEARALVRHGAHRAAVQLLVVERKVLGRGDDAVPLDARDRRPRQLGAEVRILAAQALEDAPAERHPRHVETRAERHVRARLPELAAQGVGPARDGLLVPSGRKGQGARPRGGGADACHACRGERLGHQPLRAVRKRQPRYVVPADTAHAANVQASDTRAVEQAELLC